MTYWTPLIVDGVAIDLAHLEPFEFQMAPRDWTELATISVRFTDHCFTEAFDPRHHTAVVVTSQSSPSESRGFAPDRYELSKLLPGILSSLGAKRVASTREGNLVYVELAGGARYAVFFTLRRHNPRRAELFVVSAYPMEEGRRPADTGSMRFDLALAKVLRGERPKFPAR